MKKILIAFALYAFSSTALANGYGQTVAVIDTSYSSKFSDKFTRAGCFSTAASRNENVQTNKYATITRYTYLNKISSSCSNEKSTLISSDSNKVVSFPSQRIHFKDYGKYYGDPNLGPIGAYSGYKPSEIAPRSILTNFIYSYEEFHSFYDYHGDDVLKQIFSVAPSTKIFPLVWGHVNSDTKYTECVYIGAETNKDRIGHDTYEKRYDKFKGCYTGNIGQILNAVRNVNAYSNGVSTINISAGSSSPDLCRNQTGFQEFAALQRKGIAVVAAAGNTSGEKVIWPACLSNVFSVAQVNNQGQVFNSSVANGEIVDFVALGQINSLGGTNENGTSFAAPLVSGAFAVLKSKRPKATIYQIESALRKTGSSVNGLPNARTINLDVAVQELLNPTPETNPEPVSINTTVTPKYGFGYGSSYHRSGLTYPVIAESGPSEDADVWVVFDAFDVDIKNELSVYINGHFIGYVSDGIKDGLNTYRFLVNPAWVNSGDNNINIVSNVGDSNWGVTNFRMSVYEPPHVNLSLNRPDTGKYGRNFGTNAHTRVISAYVDIADNHDHVLTWRGYNVLSSDQITVFVNGKKLGTSKTGYANSLTANNKMLIPATWLQAGINKFSFKIKENDTRNWGVSDIYVKSSPVLSLLGKTRLGYGFGNNEHRTRGFLRFTQKKDDILMSLTGWEISHSKEVAVYLNNQFFTYLNNSKQDFIITKNQQKPGTNYLTLRNAYEPESHGFNTERWGVVVNAKQKNPQTSITSIITLLLLSDEAKTE